MNTASFVRGKTYHGGQTAPSSGQSKTHEGLIRTFENIDPATPALRRSGGEVVCILVRNASTVALLPKMVVKWKSGKRGLQVDGFCNADFENCAGVVDEFLPSSGCPVNDLCWITVQGYTLVKTDLVGDAGTEISVNSPLVAQTAAASTGTTAGRVQKAIFTDSTQTSDYTDIARQVLNSFGRALTANTTGQTNREILADVNFLK